MKAWPFTAVFAAGLVVGCMAGGPPLTAQSPPAGRPAQPSTVPSATPGMSSGNHGPAYGTPLILDRTDLRLGTTVQFGRIPNLGELNDLQQLPALAHLVLALPAWPATYAELQALEQLPYEADVIVVLPGYPPSREAAEAWNLLNARVRLVMVVDAPPASNTVVADLNAMRGLERVIAQTDYPSRTGFERLQRPLSFRKVVE